MQENEKQLNQPEIENLERERERVRKIKRKSFRNF